MLISCAQNYMKHASERLQQFILGPDPLHPFPLLDTVAKKDGIEGCGSYICKCAEMFTPVDNAKSCQVSSLS